MAVTAVVRGGKYKHRNARVRQIDRDAWRRARKQRFNRACNFAAAAKATRTAFEVTQAELAKELDCSVQAIVNRENGFYAWRIGRDALEEYQAACARIVRR